MTEMTEQELSKAHDEWCSRMQGEGWVYGHDYSEAKKQHPYLIRYDKLSADREPVR